MVSTKKTMLHTAATAIIFMACLLIPGMCLADSGEWTWMSGSDQIGEFGVYGTKGVPRASNVPGARNESVSWTDDEGNLWLFGGKGLDNYGYSDLLNDLWRYDIITDEWTWMSGSDQVNALGVYGSKTVPDAANTPGARRGAVGWIDSAGDLWLFGGQGYDEDDLPQVWFEGKEIDGWLNDMWRYDTATNQWSWEWGYDNMTHKDEKSQHDDKGYPGGSYQPGARVGAISWIDSYGFMWLFGGYGWQDRDYFETGSDDPFYCWQRKKDDNENGGGEEEEEEDPAKECPDPGALNDLWVFNSVTREWAWVSGSDNTNQYGSYGTMGEPSFEAMPGARLNSIPWIDKHNNLWLFGGTGKDLNVPEGFHRRMTDLWRYDPVTKMWTFLDGYEVGDQPGVYDANIGPLLPGCRQGSISWTDNDGKFWLLGGEGLASTYAPIGGRLNDLWRYDPATQEWSWLGGSDEISNPNETIIGGVYGIKGVPDENNVTGARSSAVPWIDSLGNLWLFGGFGFDGYEGYGRMNDLWRIFGATPDCFTDADCEDDDLFCTGQPRCYAGECVFREGPCQGDTPACDEESQMCFECIEDFHCNEGFQCKENMCEVIPRCGLAIKKDTLSTSKLWKDKKVTFKILTTSFGPVDMGPDIRILSTKTNAKKGMVKVKTIVPAGLRPQTIPVWVGECKGDIYITE